MAFLEWRREVAGMEENNVSLAISPFEKNLEVWKQLWRVIEKSDLLVQIVDGRNPYFFYSADLNTYISEVEGKKDFMLLINKADYLSEGFREHWSTYFNEHNVNHIFFSALVSQAELDEEEDEEDEEEVEKVEPEKPEFNINTSRVYNREDLLSLLNQESKRKNKPVTVGMIGYPNVGKSSVINVLCGRKRVGVAAMPGKTKHFQTL